MENNEQRRLMIRYLTGQASDSEREELELAYTADPDLLARLIALENDLLDSHAAGTLDGAEAEHLEAHYLAGSIGRQKSAFAETLTTYISRTKGSAERSRPDVSPLPVRPRFAMNLTMRAVLSIAMALAIFIGVLWAIESNYRMRGELARLQQEAAKQKENARQLTARLADVEKKLLAAESGNSGTEAPATDLRPTFASLVLRGSATRGENRETTLVLSPLVSSVRIQIILDKDSYSTYRVVIRTADGATVREKNTLRSQTGREGVPIIIVDVPAKIFQNGDYVVLLYGVTGGSSVEDVSAYTVRIRRVTSQTKP